LGKKQILGNHPKLGDDTHDTKKSSCPFSFVTVSGRNRLGRPSLFIFLHLNTLHVLQMESFGCEGMWEWDESKTFESRERKWQFISEREERETKKF
jgi:hypothetical protein